MTTENVAILFTDIVGSTEMSQRMSPEAADEVRREHFSILRRALTEAGGSEVKTTGDGLMVVAASARNVIAVQAGDLDEVDRCIEIAGWLASQLGQPTLNWAHTIELATRSLISGDTSRAEQLANKAFQIGTESGQPDAGRIQGVSARSR